ncbi:MAG: hypothetical protein WAS05_00230 [Candidatus Nanopelagicales bacterium]
MSHFIIADPTDERARVAEAAVEVHTARGFTVLGPAALDGSLRTVEEVAEAEKQKQDELAEVVDPEPITVTEPATAKKRATSTKARNKK